MRVVFVDAGASQHSSFSKSDGWLTVDREYVVLGVYGHSHQIKFRILGDDKTTPALHFADRFKIVSSDIPPGWVFRLFPGGEWEIGPDAWSGDGFWSAYFDDEPSAKAAFDLVSVALGARDSA